MLETSAFKTLYGGQFAPSTQLTKLPFGKEASHIPRGPQLIKQVGSVTIQTTNGKIEFICCLLSLIVFIVFTVYLSLNLFVVYVYLYLFYFLKETSHQTSSPLYQKTAFLDKWLHCK